MHISKQHLSVISGAADDGISNTPFVLRRDVALALIVVAILLLGAAVGTFSPQTGVVPAGQVETASPQPSNDFVYFPSQFVNQGTEMPDPIAQF